MLLSLLVYKIAPLKLANFVRETNVEGRAQLVCNPTSGKYTAGLLLNIGLPSFTAFVLYNSLCSDREVVSCPYIRPSRN